MEDSRTLTEWSDRVVELGRGKFFLKSMSISTLFREICYKLFALVYHMVHVLPVGRLVTSGDEPNQGGSTHRSQELNRLMTGGAGRSVEPVLMMTG